MTQAQALSVLMEFRTVNSSKCVHHGTELNIDWLVDDSGTSAECVDGIQNVQSCECFHHGTELNTDRLVDDPGTSAKRVDGIQNSGEL